MAVLTGQAAAAAQSASAARRATIAPGASAARRAMIDGQLRVSGVSDSAVLAAMGALAREDFVPAGVRATAYIDRAVPLGSGRFLAPPLSHGAMLSEAAPTAADSVLLVGGGTGYLAALVAPLVASLQVVESADALAAAAPQQAGQWIAGPLAQGVEAGAPYSLIVIDGAIAQFPDPLAAQLAENGRVVTGLIERGVARLAVGRKTGGTVGFLTLGEIDLAPLAEFAAPRPWAF
jgi:protein-L-isoaspartate(D-aspartate) O-methyltransferase